MQTRPKSNPYIFSLTFSTLLIAAFALPGCSFVGSDGQSKGLDSLIDQDEAGDNGSEPVSRGKKVRWDGGGVILGQADNLAFTPDTLRQTVARLNGESKNALATHLISHYPDVALSTLQQIDPETQELDALQLIAKSFDDLCGSANSRHWQDFFAELAGPQSESLNRKRRKFWDLLKRHQPEAAMKLGLVKSLNRSASPLVVADCHRLEAIAQMMSGKTKDAVKSLRAALTISDSICPYLGNSFRLLLGEFYRHNKEFELWQSTWKMAVNRQSDLLVQNRLNDPQFWSRAAYLRPAKTEWPNEAIEKHLKFLAPYGVNPNTTESVIWCSSGYQHLLRTEGQNAVLAFKKSEAIAQATGTKTHLQLQQARGMILAGQPGPASAILIRLITQYEKQQDKENFSDRCKAILGSMKLQNGGIEQGMNLIQSAMDTVVQWPEDERLRAEADFALALLVRGRQDEGLTRLRKVQQRFVVTGQWEQAHQCLWNIAKFYEKTEQHEQHRDALRALQSFESGAHSRP